MNAAGKSVRILMTVDAVGGVWRYSLELAAALAPLGVRTGLAVMGPLPTAGRIKEALAIPGLTLAAREGPLEWMPECTQDDLDQTGAWLLSLAERFRPDVIHLNGYAHATLPWARPKVVVAHSCVLSWWRAVHREQAPSEWQPYARRVGRALEAADVVVSPTAALLREMVETYGIAATGKVIWNGVASGAFAPGRKEDIVLGAGRLWDAGKNCAALDRAAARVPWPVLVAGERTAPDGSSMTFASAQPLGLLPPADLAAWMGRARVFASPARYEPFGLAVLEAALSGCALVLGDIPTLRELWEGCAMFVDPHDDAAIASAIRTLIASPAFCDALGAAARARGLKYGALEMARQYHGLYAQLAVAKAA